MKYLSLLVSSVLLFSGMTQAASVQFDPPPPSAMRRPAPPAPVQVNSIIVQFKNLNENRRGVPIGLMNQVNGVLRTVGLRGAFQQDLFSNFKVLRVAPISRNPQASRQAMELANIQRACGLLKQRLPFVQSADPNGIMRAQ